ncbi:MAG: putative methylaconitate Delta-isomerase PrpF [Herminiimonas sp.]|nr:putative methylaconitate Delta-isomerase PrpF [Herminiimonas sp.]
MNRIPAWYMRGGTSKGVFFHASDLPEDPVERDAVLLRVVGSPDPYGKHSDGMGGATSSTSKVVLLSPSKRPGCDVDYFFGAVSIETPLIDWSGNCGNLSAAVGPAAVHMGLVDTKGQDAVLVHIWQQNISQHITSRVRLRAGLPIETGTFQEDGVAFGSAEIELAFIEGEDASTALLPTGNVVDILKVPGVGPIECTLITAGNPTLFIDAAALGFTGKESQQDVNGNAALLARCEAVRAHAAVAMGLAMTAERATQERPATPKLSWVAPADSYVTSAGVTVDKSEIDVLARILSMGKLHHAFTGTGAIALAVAAALPGSVVARNLRRAGGSGESTPIRIGHLSGKLSIGATVRRDGEGRWAMDKAILSRSARLIMSGWVHLPS